MLLFNVAVLVAVAVKFAVTKKFTRWKPPLFEIPLTYKRESQDTVKFLSSFYYSFYFSLCFVKFCLCLTSLGLYFVKINRVKSMSC